MVFCKIQFYEARKERIVKINTKEILKIENLREDLTKFWYQKRLEQKVEVENFENVRNISYINPEYKKVTNETQQMVSKTKTDYWEILIKGLDMGFCWQQKQI